MSKLPQPALCSYNGINLASDPCFETVSLEGRPVYDASGRTVTMIVYSITVKTIVTVDNSVNFPSIDEDPDEDPPPPDTTTDPFFTRARKLLTTPGGEFHYEDNGFGRLRINIPFAQAVKGNDDGLGARDVVWGPKPRLIRFAPRGAQKAAELTWTVDVAIPECDSAKFDGVNNWLEFCFTVAYSVDKSGYQTRTYSGFIKVPQTRLAVDVRTLLYTADEAREKIYPALIPGFRRIPGDFTLSEDKCKLTFSIRDEEVGPNYPPEGAIEVTAGHSIQSAKFFTQRWVGNLTATYELSRTVSRDVALAHFLTLFQRRRRPATWAPSVFRGPGNLIPLVEEVFGIKQPVNLDHDGPRPAVPMSIQISEPEIYGRKCASFTIAYTFFLRLEDIAVYSGLWRPVPGNDATKWAQSLVKSKAWDSRGNAGLKFDAKDDIIIDLCIKPDTAGRVPKNSLPDPKGKGGPYPKDKEAENQGWLHYEAWIEFEDQPENVEVKPLPSPTLTFTRAGAVPGNSSSSSIQPSKLASSQIDDDEVIQVNDGAPQNDDFFGRPGITSVIQRRSEPTRFVIFIGQAMRTGTPIPRPRLDSVGGVKPILVFTSGNIFRQAQVGNWFGTPVYAAHWKLTYILPKKPADDVRLPFNPFE